MRRSTQPDDEEFTQRPGTAGAASVIKAGCGIRFAEDELAEGVVFEGIERLRPDAAPVPDTDSDAASGEYRPVEPHHKPAG